MDEISRAQAFAEKAHAGQRRKYTGYKYITHPQAVAEILQSVHADENMIIAAWLHDVVEDTEYTVSDIRYEFGSDVSDLVSSVTDISTANDGNRAERKRIDRDHVCSKSERAKCIKLADLIDNSKSITAHDPKFSRVYMREKSALLIDMARYGFSTETGRKLYQMAAGIVLDYMDNKSS